MKLNTRCRYGTRAMIEIARHYGINPVKRKDISACQKISDSYLENILIALKTGGLIRTVRGPAGGYVLMKAPAEITLLDILQALESSLAPVECVEEKSLCEMNGTCDTRELWKELHERQKAYFRGITLDGIIKRKGAV